MAEFTRDRLIGAPAERLWTFLDDVDRRGDVDGHTVSSRLLAPGGPDGTGVGRRERHVMRYAGADMEVDLVVIEHDAPRSIGWRTEELRAFGRTLHREQVQLFRLEPEGEATRVQMHVRMKPRGLWERLATPLSRRQTLVLMDRTLDGLERLASGDAPPRADAPAPPPRGAPSLAAGIDIATLSLGLTVLTGVAYLVMRTITDLFYAPLRLSPEDVGLGQPELLGRSLGLIAAALLVTVDLAILAGDVAGRRWVRWLTTLPLLGVWFLIGWFVESWLPQIIVGATSIVQVAIAIVGSRRVMTEATTVRRWASLLLLVTTLLSLLAYASVLASLAVQSRRDVEAGAGLSEAASVLLPWEATPADIAWKGRTPPPLDVPQCGIYLGASGPTSLVYDPQTQALLRLPTVDVILRLRARTGASCP